MTFVIHVHPVLLYTFCKTKYQAARYFFLLNKNIFQHEVLKKLDGLLWLNRLPAFQFEVLVQRICGEVLWCSEQGYDTMLVQLFYH